MAKINELRIGNLFYYGVEKEDAICEIVGIGSKEQFDGLVESRNKYGLNSERDLDFFIPIPITEERLLMLGLLNLKDSNYGLYKYVECSGVISLRFEKNAIHIMPKTEDLKYVHQLQNWYFYLKGKELEII